MKNMFRTPLLATAFAGLLSVALTACGGASSDQPASSADSSAQSAAEQVASETTATSTTVSDATPMTYFEYVAAAVDDPVVVEAYVQGKQEWWQGKATLYLQDKDGAYFAYQLDCTEDDYAKLTEGVKVKVSGFKGNFNGEDEIVDGAFEIVDDGDTYVASATDVTSKLGTDELVDFQNQKVAFTGLTIAASKDASGNEVAYLYNYDGSGSEGDDLYFNVSDGTNTYNFTVESYLTDADSDVYKAVKNLKVGDTVDLEGFLYWYEGANPHITSVTVK